MVPSVICSNCGVQVAAGGRFCAACGYPVAQSTLPGGEAQPAFDPWADVLHKLRRATYGEYEIKSELGRGGMAIVFLAHDFRLNRKVAVKVMLPGLLYTERGWERFLAEARTAAKLDHPNVSYIHSVKDKDRFFYFVMKYVDGRPLDDILSRSGPLPIPVAQSILVQVARGLEYAHREGVVHRDIKPANIMIDKKGNAIVMDFGIARVEDTARFTQTGGAIGSPAYMSPEQCRGDEVAATSDQYSLGVVAYELFSGRPPFTGSSAELQVAHMRDAPMLVEQLRPDLPPELANAVMRMIEKNPANRFASLSDLIAIFGAGIDPHATPIADQLTALVLSGPPRRQSLPSSTIRPLPAMPVDAQSDTPDSPPPFSEPAADPDAPTQPTPIAIPDANRAETRLIPVSGERPRAVAAAKPRPLPALMAGVSVVVLVIAVMLMRSSRNWLSRAPRAVPQADATPTTAAAAVLNALGDSIVVGHGPDANVALKGALPRTVSPDAIAMFSLALNKGSKVTVGDTVRITLDALDDSGLRVTSPQIVWATSNPRIATFAGPGRLVGVRAGKVTITVSAGTTTGSLNVTVGARAKQSDAQRKH